MKIRSVPTFNHAGCRATFMRSRRRGGFLVEGTIAVFLLVVIAFALLESSLNILRPRSYVMQQNMTDAYMSYEVAVANRVDFDEIATGGDWPLYPAHKDTKVTVGTLPGDGGNVTATLIRTRIAPTRTAHGGHPVLGLDDLGISIWKLQSHLVYTIGGQEYVKSRTVIRSQ